MPVVQPPAGREPSEKEAALAYEENGITHTPFVDEGTSINSDAFNALPTAEFKTKITAWLEEKGIGQKKVNYKLRDAGCSAGNCW